MHIYVTISAICICVYVCIAYAMNNIQIGSLPMHTKICILSNYGLCNNIHGKNFLMSLLILKFQASLKCQLL